MCVVCCTEWDVAVNSIKGTNKGTAKSNIKQPTRRGKFMPKNMHTSNRKPVTWETTNAFTNTDASVMINTSSSKLEQFYKCLFLEQRIQYILLYVEHRKSPVFSPIIRSIDSITSGQSVRNDQKKRFGDFLNVYKI